MQLSKNFSLDELIASQTAARMGIDNTPTDEVIRNLKALCDNILQPLRDSLNLPIVISSGYRSPELNRAVGGVSNSEHMFGKAVDLTVPGQPNKAIAQYIIDANFPFNQLILEFYRVENPYYGWVHCSYSLDGNKGEIYTFDGRTYTKGLG